MVVGMLSDIRHADICELVQLWAINRVLRERGAMPVVLQCPDAEGCLPEFALEQFTVCAAGRRSLEAYGIYRQIGGFVTADSALAAAGQEDGDFPSEETSAPEGAFGGKGGPVPEEDSDMAGDLDEAEVSDGAADSDEAEDETEISDRAVDSDEAEDEAEVSDRTADSDEAEDEAEDSGDAETSSPADRQQSIDIRRAERKKPVFLEHPLLLLQQVRYHGISEKPAAGGKYAFLDIREQSEERMERAARLCREMGLRMIVCADNAGPARAAEAQFVRCARPEKYLGLIWQAEAVITDNYFGAVMAAMHEKPFAVLPPRKEQEAERLRSLLNELCLSGHLAEDGELSSQQLRTDNLIEFRRALHAMRDGQLEMLERCLAFEEEDMLVKCPVRLPASQCCACGACEAVCPEDAIRMVADQHGYYYPVVDRELCNDCGWCAEACVKKGRRQLVQYSDATLPEIYAAEAPNESGAYGAYSGIFRELVHFVVTQRQGIVFGTRLNERHEPVLAWTENEDEAAEFAEQRFLMSRTREGFRKIKELLDKDCFVMFAGIPCECAGLKSYLKRNYPKLFVCEFLCHGAASEELFHQYIAFLEEKNGVALKGIHFGEYPAGDYASGRVILADYADGSQSRRKYTNSAYYRMLEQQALVNEACTNCSYNGKKRVGDITLGEFKRMNFGEVPEEWRSRAVVIANTEKGSRVFASISEHVRAERTDYDTLFRYQHRKTAALVRERSELLARLGKKDFRGILKAYAKQER
ncbi:MAG: Coenzyme F420 hydrogenase/dehydrogenase, beta subunit C-terminal domain [Lachnospiraceae bacterium]|nr:Coenzyme F420 hydrogenase/dehydrogenase, beta subunit C-terminal domain [Lachnospiraceae bacterium]